VMSNSAQTADGDDGHPPAHFSPKNARGGPGSLPGAAA